MNEPFFSVVLPVLDGEDYLAEALDSCLAQTLDDFELIICDGGSTDRTCEIAARRAASDSRIRFESHSKRLGQVGDIHRAMAYAGGKWLKLVCHDDLMERECLEVLFKTASESPSSVGLIGNGERHIFANGEVSTSRPFFGLDGQPRIYTGTDYVRAMFSRHSIDPLPALTTATVRRSHWERFSGFRPGLTNFDTLGWVEFLMACDYIYVPASLTVTRIHGNQVTSRAQQDVRTSVERQEFWREFCRENGERLRLSRAAILASKLWGPSGAATQVAIEFIKHEFLAGIRLMFKAPTSWWPLLPPLVLRSWMLELRRVRPLRNHIPRDALYS